MGHGVARFKAAGGRAGVIRARMPAMNRRLITIPISHYCERGRWALTHCGVAFTEEPHLQLMHRLATRAVGDYTSTPLLVADDGVFGDSAEIVAYADRHAPADRRLYPEDAGLRAEIEAFERVVAHSFAIEARRLLYHHMFAWGRPLLAYNNTGAPRWQAVALAVSFPLMRRLLSRALNVNADTAERAVQRIEPVLQDIEQRLSQTDGAHGQRSYLFGDSFTAADLSFAALMAPLVLPPGYGVPVPGLAELPAATAEMIRGYRDRPAGRHALQMYREHRR